MITNDPTLFSPNGFRLSPHPIRHESVAPETVMRVRWPELMCITTLAEYLDMSASTVRALVAKGLLPPATTAPTQRLKRWKRSVVDERLQSLADQNTADGMSMDAALRKILPSTQGGI